MIFPSLIAAIPYENLRKECLSVSYVLMSTGLKSVTGNCLANSIVESLYCLNMDL